MPNGGLIVLGADESRNFEAVGVEQPAKLAQQLADEARTAVSPPVQVAISSVKLGAKTLLIAEVDGLPLADRPCRYRKRAYLRQADGDYQMSEQEIRQVELQQATERPRHDARVLPGTTTEDLDEVLVTAFADEACKASRRLASADLDTLLARKHVVDRATGALTLAGIYALGEYLTQADPSLTITAAAEDPSDPDVRNCDKQTFDGPIPDLLDSAVEWVMRNTRTSVRFGPDGHGRDVPELPAVAVREIIANALVHRDLSPTTIGKDVQIRLTRDRLIVSNPGGLWGVSRDQLGSASSAVNVDLYDLCKLIRTRDGARVIEGEGGGIAAVQQSLRVAGLPTAKFIDTGVRFTVLFPRHALLSSDDLAWLSDLSGHDQLYAIQQQILVSMRHGAPWTNQMVRDEFGSLDSRNAAQVLQELVSLGLANQNGSRGSTTYTLREPKSDGLSVGKTIPEADATPVADQLTPILESRSFYGPSNGAQILLALKQGPMASRDLVEKTGLKDHQVRYSLKKLREAGPVVLEGTQGQRAAKYAIDVAAVQQAYPPLPWQD